LIIFKLHASLDGMFGWHLSMSPLRRKGDRNSVKAQPQKATQLQKASQLQKVSQLQKATQPQKTTQLHKAAQVQKSAQLQKAVCDLFVGINKNVNTVDEKPNDVDEKPKYKCLGSVKQIPRMYKTKASQQGFQIDFLGILIDLKI